MSSDDDVEFLDNFVQWVIRLSRTANYQISFSPVSVALAVVGTKVVVSDETTDDIGNVDESPDPVFTQLLLQISSAGLYASPVWGLAAMEEATEEATDEAIDQLAGYNQLLSILPLVNLAGTNFQGSLQVKESVPDFVTSEKIRSFLYTYQDPVDGTVILELFACKAGWFSYENRVVSIFADLKFAPPLVIDVDQDSRNKLIQDGFSRAGQNFDFVTDKYGFPGQAIETRISPLRQFIDVTPLQIKNCCDRRYPNNNRVASLTKAGACIFAGYSPADGSFVLSPKCDLRMTEICSTELFRDIDICKCINRPTAPVSNDQEAYAFASDIVRVPERCLTAACNAFGVYVPTKFRDTICPNLCTSVLNVHSSGNNMVLLDDVRMKTECSTVLSFEGTIPDSLENDGDSVSNNERIESTETLMPGAWDVGGIGVPIVLLVVFVILIVYFTWLGFTIL